MKKEMLINVLQSEECRIAIVEDGVLEELYVERASQESYVGNIYKGRIVNIEPSIQAAFVDFGIGRNGFLHVSDVDPAYYKHLLSKEALAEYEAELEREHTGGRGRDRGDRNERGDRGDRGRGRGDRDRGPRREAPQPTAWLEPQPTARPHPEPAADDEFNQGLDEDLPFAEGIEDGGEFSAGVMDEAARETHPAEKTHATEDAHAAEEAHPPIRAFRSSPETAVSAPASPRAPVAQEEDNGFASGIAEEENGFAAGITEEGNGFASGITEEENGFASGITEEENGFAAGITEEENGFAAGITDSAPAEADESAKPRKPRTRRSKETAEEGDGLDEGASEKKPRGRKPRKKAEGEPNSGDTPPDAPPRVMGGAEHRTTPPEGEPEIKPFFEGIPTDDFDIEGPNDRFAGSSPETSEDPGFELVDDEVASSDAPETVVEEPGVFGEQKRSEEAQEPAPHTGRGFNDAFDEGRPPRGDRGDRGDRSGRSRGRGDRDRGRGGRDSRERSGSRGGPGRDRDRGPRSMGPPAGRDRGLPKPPIQEIFKRGQEVIVQVIKEGIGTKGPTLSTYISIAGRYLVLMPSLGRVGVSRKIEDHDARRRLREIMSTLSPPKGVGFIVRTAAVDRDAKELRNDLAYLLRLWQVVVKRIKRVSAPVEIYRESDMITRTIRDIFTNDVDSIWVDEGNAFAHASEFLQIVMPRYASRIRFFDETEPLFHRYGIEDEIAKMHSKRLDLPGGGSIIIEQTEALVAIDVNSGSFRAENNAEETAYQMNLRAAKEIARQLRLRDLGGVIVNDFIDMRSESHRRNVENALRTAMERDRARTKILRISQFGLIEMTRQRIRPSLKRSIFSECQHCRGTGAVKTHESMSIEVMRLIQLAAHRTPAIQAIEVAVHAEVANYLLNRKRKELARLEDQSRMQIQITGQPGVSPEMCAVKCLDHNGSEVRLLPPTPVRLSGGRAPRHSAERERRFPQPLD